MKKSTNKMQNIPHKFGNTTTTKLVMVTLSNVLRQRSAVPSGAEVGHTHSYSLTHECKWRWWRIRTFLYIRCTMPTLLVLATMGVVPAGFLLLFGLLGLCVLDLRALFELRFGVDRARFTGVADSWNKFCLLFGKIKKN